MALTVGYEADFSGGTTDVLFPVAQTLLVSLVYDITSLPRDANTPDSDPDHFVRTGWWGPFDVGAPPDSFHYVQGPFFFNFRHGISVYQYPDGAAVDGFRVQVNPGGVIHVQAYVNA